MENIDLIALPETTKLSGIVAERVKVTSNVEKSFITDNKEKELKKLESEFINDKEFKDELEEVSLEEEVSIANKLMSELNTKIKYVLDERSKTGVVVQIINNESGELIKQLPPEELLDLMNRLKGSETGILVDNRG